MRVGALCELDRSGINFGWPISASRSLGTSKRSRTSLPVSISPSCKTRNYSGPETTSRPWRRSWHIGERLVYPGGVSEGCPRTHGSRRPVSVHEIDAPVATTPPMEGGILYEAWKGAGRRSDPSSHRSLFVSSVVGKCFHKLTRRKIQSYVSEGLHEFHLGARKGQPVLYPAAYILSFLRRARRRKASVAILFLDAEAAYYRICRELATGPIEGDEAFALSFFRSFFLPFFLSLFPIFAMLKQFNFFDA